jgi:hypothetical protein
VIAACVSIVPSIVVAQQPPARGGLPDKYVNLQVFPKDTKPDVLIQAMKNFTRALGVRCPFCHVGEEGQPLTTFDFAADIKPEKNIARNMMRMSAEINVRLQKEIPDAVKESYQVTCYTCHRGAQHPVHSPDAAPKPPGL